MPAFIIIFVLLFIIEYVLAVITAVKDSRRHGAVVRKWVLIFFCAGLFSLIGLDFLIGADMPEHGFLVLFICSALFPIAAGLTVRAKINRENARQGDGHGE